MVLSYLQFPTVFLPKVPTAKPSTTPHTAIPAKFACNFSVLPFQPRQKFTFILKAAKEEECNSSTPDEATPSAPAETPQEGGGATKSGNEMKSPEMEIERKEESGLLSGVADEIREIEWPGFGKVLGTTGVVLGVIAGASVVLLTVNAVLAEISDRVFVGKGIQDFFG